MPCFSMASPRWMAPTLAALLGVAHLAGCGPILSTVGIVRAERALQEAMAAGSAEKAPYPTELARSLLEKAKEEQGYSSYDTSTDLAEQAAGFATEALKLSQGEGPMLPPPLSDEGASAGDGADISTGASAEGAPAADEEAAGGSSSPEAEPGVDEEDPGARSPEAEPGVDEEAAGGTSSPGAASDSDEEGAPPEGAPAVPSTAQDETETAPPAEESGGEAVP